MWDLVKIWIDLRGEERYKPTTTSLKLLPCKAVSLISPVLVSAVKRGGGIVVSALFGAVFFGEKLEGRKQLLCVVAIGVTLIDQSQGARRNTWSTWIHWKDMNPKNKTWKHWNILNFNRSYVGMNWKRKVTLKITKGEPESSLGSRKCCWPLIEYIRGSPLQMSFKQDETSHALDQFWVQSICMPNINFNSPETSGFRISPFSWGQPQPKCFTKQWAYICFNITLDVLALSW